MSIFEAIIIGIVQGLTEFLPISSSGHTIIIAKLLNTQISLEFELLIHLASLLAVIIVLNKPIISLIKNPFKKEARLLIVASIPTVIIFLIFKDFFEYSFNGQFLAICFLISAMLILFSGIRKNFNPNYKMTYLDAIIIGSVQGMAGMAGISRSGSTISSSIMLGINKKESAKFSFLLSIPIIIGSFTFEFISLASTNSFSLEILPAIFGFLSAFVFGFIALKFMINKLTKYFDYFAIYLLALSIFLFLDSLILHWL